MKINLNQRSVDELLHLMGKMGITSPTHLVQKLITQSYKSLIPFVEDNNHEHRTKEKQEA
jgi:hypothetical protein